MLPQRWERILREVLTLPTAPFAERHVLEYISAFCRDRPALRKSRDAGGNILIRLKRGSGKAARPVCLCAHLDHPGFIVDRMQGPGRLRVLWRGGVRASFFVGSRVRFFVDHRWIKGTIRSIVSRRGPAGPAVKSALVDLDRKLDLPRGAVGMWDLPDPVVRRGRIHARACDDLAGAAGMLCCMDELYRKGAAADCYFLFTRAEETGFIGAITACRNKTIPKRCILVAVENSSELPSARMGAGPILRVGDKASVFTPQATLWCAAAAEAVRKRDRKFIYQRKLMDGGTCESSAYCAFGYDATGVCLALGNYHNMNKRTGRIGAEYIDLEDFRHLVVWFQELCRPHAGNRQAERALPERLRKLEAESGVLLEQTRDGTGIA